MTRDIYEHDVIINLTEKIKLNLFKKIRRLY